MSTFRILQRVFAREAPWLAAGYLVGVISLVLGLSLLLGAGTGLTPVSLPFDGSWTPFTPSRPPISKTLAAFSLGFLSLLLLNILVVTRTLPRDSKRVIWGTLLAVIAFLSSIQLITLFIAHLPHPVGSTVDGLTALGLSSVLFLRGLAVARTLSRYAERLTTHHALFRLLARLRLWFFHQAVPLAPARLGFFRSADLLNRVVADIDALDALYLRVLVPVGLLLFVLLVGGALLFVTSGVGLAVAFVVILLLFTAGVGAFSLFMVRAASAESVTHLADLRSHAVDGLAGMGELIAHDAVGRQHVTLAESSSGLVGVQLAVARASAASTALSGLAVTALGLCVALMAPRSLSVPLFFGVMIMSELLLQIPGAFISWGRIKAAANRVVALALQPPPVPEPPSRSAPSSLPPSEGVITFDSVSLSYDGRPRPALQDVSFSLAPGERVMITGASGAGKSSLATLLLKFVRPTAGRVTWGGVDLADMPGDDVRRRIGFLSQRTTLLSGTVRENLLLADPAASDAQMWQALEGVGMGEVVRALPDGLDTWVGEGGLLLSGGQARRLALALVVLKDSPLWILDEPTEGLDDATAQALMPTLAQASRGRTLLFITHRPDFGDLVGVTRRLRLEQGRLLEAGSAIRAFPP